MRVKDIQSRSLYYRVHVNAQFRLFPVKLTKFAFLSSVEFMINYDQLVQCKSCSRTEIEIPCRSVIDDCNLVQNTGRVYQKRGKRIIINDKIKNAKISVI